MRRKSFVAAAASSHQDCIAALVALRTWQTVTAGLFPPTFGGPCPERLLAEAKDQILLHAGRLVCLLHPTGLVADPDPLWRGPRLPDGDLLNTVAHPLTVPAVLAEKLLERPRGQPCLEGDRHDTLPLHV